MRKRMAYFAVDINVLQHILTTTEVVVEANNHNEAVQYAKEQLASVLPSTFGQAQLVGEETTLADVRNVDADPELGEDTVPYVYNLYTHSKIPGPGIPEIAPEPDYDSNPWPIESFQDITPVVEELPAPDYSINIPGEVLPHSGSFASRPTANYDQPLSTLPSGYTPLDGVYRERTPLPYYLGGRACVELGAAEYCGATGVSQTKHASSEPSCTGGCNPQWNHNLNDDWDDEEEVCDGVDNNCADGPDEPTATGAATWYADTDGDGVGDEDWDMW